MLATTHQGSDMASIKELLRDIEASPDGPQVAAIFDFDGTDPQAQSSVNFFLNEDMFKMFFGSFTINLVDPQILFNDGFYDLVEVRIPEGTLLKPKYPAALSGRTHALGRIFDVMGGLLGEELLGGTRLAVAAVSSPRRA